jgi:hypothetical protein
MTDTVEALGLVEHADARPKLTEAAAELRVLAEQLVEAAGVTWTASASASEAEAENSDSELASVIESVRATLQEVGSLIAATKTAKAARKPGKAPPRNAEPEADADEDDESDDDADTESTGGGKKRAKKQAAHPERDEIHPKLVGLTDSVTKLVEGLRQQTQRLAALEKRFGVPHSASARESPRVVNDEVGWPIDLNRPLDRGNVDKAVSFHDA